MNTIKIDLDYGIPLSYIFLFMIQSIILSLILIFAFFSISDMIFKSITTFFCLAILVYSFIKFKERFFNLRYKILKKIIHLSDLKGDEHVLDLGTGSGFLAIGFATRLNENGQVTGLDKYKIHSPYFIVRIQEKLKINFIGYSIEKAVKNKKRAHPPGSCVFLEGDLTTRLPFPDESFNVIVSSQSLYCLPKNKLVNTLHEVDRTLKKGGKIIFFESRGFLHWDINNINGFYLKKKYSTDIIYDRYMKNNCIFYGSKHK